MRKDIYERLFVLLKVTKMDSEDFSNIGDRFLNH